jgi:transposase
MTESLLKKAVLPYFNPLSPELIPICYLLALLGAHHFLHVSRIRVKLLTFR